MIIVRLMGGLGNQMFQYAVGRRLALAKNVPFKLDLANFEIDRSRPYELKYLEIIESFASSKEVAKITGSQGIRSALVRLRDTFKPYYRRSWFTQRGMRFDPHLFDAPDDVYLFGHWQSEKFFQGIEDVLRREFTVKTKLNSTNAAMAQQIASTNAVSVHIRRGDYISNPTTHRLHGVCSLEYYAAAMEHMAHHIDNPHFYVFSDDAEWASQNLVSNYAITHVTHNPPDQGYEDLRLMSLCQHHIIANSSFSWWGAWLGTAPNKRVIAPQKWFDEFSADTRDLIPEAWHRI